MATTVRTLDPRARSLIERAVTILREHGATEIYVYGSVTTDRWDPERSDIDFAVRGLAPGRCFRAAADVVSGIGHEIDLLQLDRESRLAEFLQEEGDLVRVG